MDPGNFQNLIEQAYADPKGKPKALPLRKGFYNNPQGGARDTTVSVNQYRVLSFYDGPIYQYDVNY